MARYLDQLSYGEIVDVRMLGQSLSEIVIALRVPPEDVRDLYHTWLVALWAGELQRKEPALPARRSDQDAMRRVTPVQLAQLLAALPSKQSTRISIARMVGEFVVPDEADGKSFVEYRNLCELGGFDVSSPIAVATSWRALGQGSIVSPRTASSHVGYAGKCSCVCASTACTIAG